MTCRLRWCAEMETKCRIPIWRTFEQIQWHVMPEPRILHCRVLPLDEFTVTIPEPHATLQGAVTWRKQCRDRATLQGVRIPSGILKIVFRHSLFYLFLFLMQFRLWRAAAFVSSSIHLFFEPPCILHIDYPTFCGVTEWDYRRKQNEFFLGWFFTSSQRVTDDLRSSRRCNWCIVVGTTYAVYPSIHPSISPVH